MWYENEGMNMDTVLSTKVIINRNIKGFPFPPKMSDADKENVLGMVRQAAGSMGLNFVRTDELDEAAKAETEDIPDKPDIVRDKELCKVCCSFLVL